MSPGFSPKLHQFKGKYTSRVSEKENSSEIKNILVLGLLLISLSLSLSLGA